jgi:hypothetical protein
LLAEHFKEGGCDVTHLQVQPIEQIICDKKDAKSMRLKRESFWIKELRTLTPYGLNDRLDSHNWRFRTRNDIAGKTFNRLSNVRGCRGSRKGHEKKSVDKVNFFDDAIETKLKYLYCKLHNWRHFAHCKINSFTIPKLRSLSWVFIDLLHNHDYPKEIVNLVLDMINFRLSRHSKDRKQTNRKHYVQIYFQAKEIEDISLSSIFRKHAECIPSSFKCKDVPTVLYRRTKTIGSTIFNYKDVVDSVITDDWKVDNSHTCDCKDSKFRDPYHKHIVTGDLRLIENNKLRSLLCKGPNYREALNINWKKFTDEFDDTLTSCVKKWAFSENVDLKVLSEWKVKVWNEVKGKIQFLKKRRKRRRKIIISGTMKSYLQSLQKKYVFVPTDKAGNNIAVVCKKFYIERSMQELSIFKDSKIDELDSATYKMINKDSKFIITRHCRYMKTRFAINDVPEKLPFLYWIPKMHKKPYSKQRYIAASACCSTKPISAILTKVLKVIEKQHRFDAKKYHTYHGVDPMWIIHNSTAVHEMVASFNRQKKCVRIDTYDFSTLYTSIPHLKLKQRMSLVIKKAFKSSKKEYISVYKNSAGWSDNPREGTLHMDCKTIIRSLYWLIDNIFVMFGDKCFRQIIGIPMGTDCAPFLANLFLYSYEFEWIDRQVKCKRFKLLKQFKRCSRYIDDLLLINNTSMVKVVSDIYPEELVLVPEDSDGLSSPFLDLRLIVTDGVVSSSIFDKRDGFDFPIVNFPTLDGNIPVKSSYGVFIGELVRYARACTYYEDFKDRSLALVKKLKNQCFTKKLLKSAWKRFCDKHILLIQKYGREVLNLYKHWM